MSRRLLPKQFLPLVTEHSLLQDTMLRLKGLENAGAPIVISNNDHRFLVAEQLNELGVKPAVQILEPMGRNTAPAVAVAALQVARENPNGILFVPAPGASISDPPAFAKAVKAASATAAAGHITTFGIKPTYPATGYGYIERGEA